jgi:hypothetical protein
MHMWIGCMVKNLVDRLLVFPLYRYRGLLWILVNTDAKTVRKKFAIIASL